MTSGTRVRKKGGNKNSGQSSAPNTFTIPLGNGATANIAADQMTPELAAKLLGLDQGSTPQAPTAPTPPQINGGVGPQNLADLVSLGGSQLDAASQIAANALGSGSNPSDVNFQNIAGMGFNDFNVNPSFDQIFNPFTGFGIQNPSGGFPLGVPIGPNGVGDFSSANNNIREAAGLLPFSTQDGVRGFIHPVTGQFIADPESQKRKDQQAIDLDNRINTLTNAGFVVDESGNPIGRNSISLSPGQGFNPSTGIFGPGGASIPGLTEASIGGSIQGNNVSFANGPVDLGSFSPLSGFNINNGIGTPTQGAVPFNDPTNPFNQQNFGNVPRNPQGGFDLAATVSDPNSSNLDLLSNAASTGGGNLDQINQAHPLPQSHLMQRRQLPGQGGSLADMLGINGPNNFFGGQPAFGGSQMNTIFDLIQKLGGQNPFLGGQAFGATPGLAGNIGAALGPLGNKLGAGLAGGIR